MARRFTNEQDVLWDIDGVIYELQYLRGVLEAWGSDKVLGELDALAGGMSREDAWCFNLATTVLRHSVSRRSTYEG